MKKNKRDRIIQILAIGSLIFIFGLPELWALEVPPLEGRVNDHAGILSSATIEQLEGILGDLEITDSTQIVVLTIPSLEGEVLEEFSIKVADQWKIGREQFDNGAILLVALKERKIRIEVGYGLEGSLTDLMAGRIIREGIVPQFKAGNFDQGVINGVQAMISVVKGEYKAPAKAPRSEDPKIILVVHGLALLAPYLAFISVLGRARSYLAVVFSGVFLPLAMLWLFKLSWIWIIWLIPIGLFSGFLLTFLDGSKFLEEWRRDRKSGGGFFSGGGGGGFFSGGGGGFGGGGASGGW
jgi:uncharacterized protein